jgi:hypothetical protein
VLVEAPKKDDKPGLSAKYDGGVKLATADDKFELKLGFKDQVRFDSSRSFDEETPTRHNQFRSRFELTRVRFGAEGHFFGKDNRFKLEAGLGDSGSFAFVKDFFVEKRLPGSKVWFRAGQWKRPFNRAELVSARSRTSWPAGVARSASRCTTITRSRPRASNGSSACSIRSTVAATGRRRPRPARRTWPATSRA